MGFNVSVSKRNDIRAFASTMQKDIENSIESSPELRKAMRRVFQAANRRIQNIQDAKLISPAVMALNKENVTNYSKFSISSCANWQQAKEEYARAQAFLSARTSTVKGCRQYKDAIMHQLGLQNEPHYFEAMYKTIATNISEGKAADYSYWSYSDAVRIIDDTVSAKHNEIEQQSKEYEDMTQDMIDEMSAFFVKTIVNSINSLFDSF